MRTNRREQTERARDEGCDCYLRCATGLPRPEIDHYGLPGPRPRHQTAAPGQRGVAFVRGWLGVGVLGSGWGCAGQRGLARQSPAARTERAGFLTGCDLVRAFYFAPARVPGTRL